MSSTTLVEQAEAEREARETAAAKAQYDAQLAAAAQQQAAQDAPTVAAVVAVAAAATTRTAAPARLPRPRAAACPRCWPTRTRSSASPTATPASAPSCYDCSGLTMMAWAQAGVSMSHGSYDQLASFPAVSMDQLQPGDLVYWDSHVGIYVGNGSVLHAPHTGTNVQITPIWPGVIGANRPG